MSPRFTPTIKTSSNMPKLLRLSGERNPGAKIYLATPRIEKPGEANLFGFLARQGGRRNPGA